MSLTRRGHLVEMRPFPVAAAIATVLLAALATTATAQFHVDGGIREQFDITTHVDEGAYDQTGGSPQGGGVTFDQNTDATNQIPGLHSQANSLGDSFGLHTHAFAQVLKPFQSNIDTDPFQRPYGVSATSEVTGDYSVTVSDPNFAPGVPVNVAYHMHLHGETLQGASNTPDTINMSRADAGAQASIRGIVNGVYSNPGGGSFTRQVDNGTETQSGSGSLVNFVNDDVITSDTFTVKNGEPFLIRAFLQSFAVAIGDFRESFTAEANSDFGNTLSFVTDGPVFDLPDGYTANSPDAGIVNNVFAAPEPSCVGLCAGLLVMFGRRSRAKHSDPRPL